MLKGVCGAAHIHIERHSQSQLLKTVSLLQSLSLSRLSVNLDRLTLSIWQVCCVTAQVTRSAQALLYPSSALLIPASSGVAWSPKRSLYALSSTTKGS